jgi:molybdate-binding protein/DNA-binding XRE family transcriptional regulator
MSENLVREYRTKRGWSQMELADRAGISRAAVSAIESQRIVPSVAAALQLAATFACTVEELFGGAAGSNDEVIWASPRGGEPCRFWQADVAGRIVYYPAEYTPSGHVTHDGVFEGGVARLSTSLAARQTLVLACCDPAVGLLAAEFTRTTGFRLLVLSRSSREALEMVKAGTAHVAGVHLATAHHPERNAEIAAEMLGSEVTLLKGAEWLEGLAVQPEHPARSLEEVIDADLVWIGREPGSGARQCLEEMLPGKTPRLIARDHRGVVDAIRCGWGDVGVCLHLPAEESRLRFIPIREEAYDLCFPNRITSDPRVQSLIKIVGSSSYRQRLGELPGYNTRTTGEVTRIGA